LKKILWILLSFTLTAAADDLNWQGIGVDNNFSTSANWPAGANLLSTTSSLDTLIFDDAVGGGGSLLPNNDLTGATYHQLQFISGNFSLSGNPIALTQLRIGSGAGEVIDDTLIRVDAGLISIATPIIVQPLAIDRVLSIETITTAKLFVGSGADLTLANLDASLVDLTADLSSGATLTLAGVTQAQRFTSSYGGGNLALQNQLSTDHFEMRSGTATLAGASGAINPLSGGASPEIQLRSGAALVLDNTAGANTDRLDDNANIRIDTGTFDGQPDLQLIGHASQAITEQVSGLWATGSGYTTIQVDGNGADVTLSIAQLGSFSRAGDVITEDPLTAPSLNFVSNQALGTQTKILFGIGASNGADGLMVNAIIDHREFATYDAVNGVKSATTRNTLAGATGADHVLVASAETLTGNVTVNSLAAAADIGVSTGPEIITLGSGKAILSGTATVLPRIAFGSQPGDIQVFGNNELAGGLSGTNGVSLSGTGALNISAASNITGAVRNELSSLVLSANDALAGSDFAGALDIGSTTQNFASLSSSNLSGTGNVSADTVALSGGVTIDADVGATSQISLTGGVTVNGVLSGAGDLAAFKDSSLGVAPTLTAQNTYTGNTTVRGLTLTDAGSISSSGLVSVASPGNGVAFLQLDYTGTDVNRLGDSATVALGVGNSVTLRLTNTAGGVNETFGTLSANGNGLLQLDLSGSGAVALNLDNLVIDPGAALHVDFGSASSLYVNNTPALIGSTTLLEGVTVKKDIGGNSMQIWAMHNSTTKEVTEANIVEASLATTTSDQFVRITDATNAPLNTTVTAAAVVVDTQQTVSGSGTLGLSTGQLAFFQDNTVSINRIDFGLEQGVLNNAGLNTVSSELVGTHGVEKVGEGTIILSGVHNVSGTTRISEGVLAISGQMSGNAVLNGGRLELLSTGQFTGNVSGTINLVGKQNYAIAPSQSIGGIDVDQNSSIINLSASTGSISNAGNATNAAATFSVNNTGTFINDGNVTTRVTNNGNFENNAALSGTFIVNGPDGTVTNNDSITLIDQGFTSGGTELIEATNTGDIINNNTFAIDVDARLIGAGLYTQNSGTTTVNGTIENNFILNSGVLKGTGRLTGDLTVNGGSVNPGNSPGTLTIGGNFTLGAGGEILLEANSASLLDQLIVEGFFDAQGGEINILLGDGLTTDFFATENIGVADFFNLGSSAANPFGNTMLMTTSLTEGTFALSFSETGAITVGAEVVPLPAAVWMFGSALGLLGWMRRKSA